MHLSRRDALARIAAFAALPLLGACGPAPRPTPVPTSPPLPQLVLGNRPLATPTPAARPTSVPSSTPVPRLPVGRPMYQMDAQHSGRSPNRGPREGRVLASFETGNFQVRDGAMPQPDIQSSAAIGSDGSIYIGNHQGVLFALRDGSPSASAHRQTPELAWRFHPPGSSSWHATPALSPDGTVYLGFSGPGSRSDIEGTLYALRAPSTGVEGEVVWSIGLGAGRLTSSPTIGPDGTIYAISGTGWLFAVSPEGQVRWSCETGISLKAAPALSPDGSTVYVSSMNGMLYAVGVPRSPDTSAKVRWTFAFADYPGRTPQVTGASPPAGANGIGSGASPTVAPDGMVYVGANNSNFYALTPDGKLLWLYEAEREIAGIWSTAALSDDASMLYFGANKGGMYALNRADGSVQWRYPITSSIYNSPALDVDGVVYTGSTVGHVYALDGHSGRVIFDYDAGVPIWTAPAVRTDGSLVVADRNGRVIVLG
jgi:large repetitive protein